MYSREKNKIKALVNAYLNENLGDDLFINILAKRYPNTEFYILVPKSYKASLPSNVVFSINKLNKVCSFFETKVNYFFSKYHFCGIHKLSRKFQVFYRKRNKLARKLDYNIYLIGSGFMENKTLSKSDYCMEYKYYSNHLHLLGCNFGPFYTEKYKSQYKSLFSSAEEVCFRDSYSYNLFDDLLNVRWASDIVFSFDEQIDNCYFEDNRKYIVISVVDINKDLTNNGNKEKYCHFIAEIANYYISRNITVVFVGFCEQQGDKREIQEIIRCLNSVVMLDNVHSVYYPATGLQKILALFKNADSIFASRYHAGILGLLFQRKTYFLSYNEKMVHVLQDIDSRIPFIHIDSDHFVSAEHVIKNYGYILSSERLLEVKRSSQEQFRLLDKLLK